MKVASGKDNWGDQGLVSKRHSVDDEGRYRDKMQEKVEDEVGGFCATWISANANRNERDGFR